MLDLLRERSFARKRVVLASGKESDFFIDCKQVVLSAEGHAIVGERMFTALSDLRTMPEAVAGVELGGCPLASAVSLVSFQRGKPLDAIYVRKTVKDHGTAQRIEGDGRLPALAKIVVLEDVVTTGGSTLAAVQQLRSRPFQVVGVIALVDRLEGGREALEAAGLEFVALYTKPDFMTSSSRE